MCCEKTCILLSYDKVAQKTSEYKKNKKSHTCDGKEGKRELGTFKQTFPPLHCVHTIDDILEITFHMGNTICTSPLWLKCLHRAGGSP